MCVAVVVKEKQGPTLEELKQMESHNPHGAGLAWPTKRGMRYRKGLTAAQIAQILPSLPRPTLLHFRWATHGPKVPALTHPFPLGDRALLSTSLEGRAPAVLIHNGVWHGHERYVPNWARPLMKRLSDTAIAAFVAGTDENILEDVAWSTAVGRVINGECYVKLRGSWEGHNGNLYSNLTWQRKSHWSMYEASWDWEEWEKSYERRKAAKERYEKMKAARERREHYLDEYARRRREEATEAFLTMGDGEIVPANLNAYATRVERRTDDYDLYDLMTGLNPDEPPDVQMGDKSDPLDTEPNPLTMGWALPYE